jgi:hypothetical protein
LFYYQEKKHFTVSFSPVGFDFGFEIKNQKSKIKNQKSKIKERREKRSGITPATEFFQIPQLTLNIRNAIAINIDD